ncbi:MAG: DUF362 domain-containing protein [Candidatus Saccharicenans sp.]|uniref:DUF362 domain-containing protein n=1 Tax=Candidatus Saccharicenans sp. TaxID=2819258 RepID=UPI00404A208E
MTRQIIEKGIYRRKFLLAGLGLVGFSALGAKELFLPGETASAPDRSFTGLAAPGSLSSRGHFPSGSHPFPSDPLAPAGKSRVLLIKTDDRADGVRKAFAFFKGTNPFQGKKVLIKPNFNTSDETPGSTHNDTLKEILEELRKAGARKLTIGDRSGPEQTEQVFDKKGIRQLAASYEADLLNFDELGPEGYVKVVPPGSHWKDGFLVARPVVEAEALISTCCLKTHGFGGVFTMSLKNSVGVVPRKGYTYMRELHSSPHQRRMIAEINYAYKPTRIILDGLVAFVDQGPMTGPRKEANVFLAGVDRVAIDAVAVAILKELGSNDAIMKPRVFEQEQIARAAELGLGVSSPDDIIIETLDAASADYAAKIRPLLS